MGWRVPGKNWKAQGLRAPRGEDLRPMMANLGASSGDKWDAQGMRAREGANTQGL